MRSYTHTQRRKGWGEREGGDDDVVVVVVVIVMVIVCLYGNCSEKNVARFLGLIEAGRSPSDRSF